MAKSPNRQSTSDFAAYPLPWSNLNPNPIYYPTIICGPNDSAASPGKHGAGAPGKIAPIPSQNSLKLYRALEVLEQTKDRIWLAKVTNALN
jgi:hypothetical protein